MLGERAEEKGYSQNSDYQGTSAFNGTAPCDQGYYETKQDAIDAFNSGNFEGDWTLADELDYGIEMGSLDERLSEGEYRRADNARKEAILALKKVRDSNAKTIMMYRSVPSDVKEGNFRNGDWVTLTREYAKEHAERVFDGDYRIIESKVPVKYLWGNGDSIHEFGYDNGNGAEVYKNTPNNVKLAAITRDDRGQLIPLSQRYDENSKDERYSIKGVHEAQLEVERLTQEAKASGWTPQQLAERITAAVGIIPLAHMPTQGLFLCCPHDPERRFESGRELFACYLARSSQKATALAAATLSESTPCSIGIRTV